MNWLRVLLALPEQRSTVAPQIDRLHFLVIGLTMFAATVIFAVALAWVIRFRRRSEEQTTPKVHASHGLELVIYLGPLAIFLALFWRGYLDFIAINTPPKDTYDVYVTAKQWMWKFSHPDGPSSIGTLRVPVGRPVRLLLTSRDVIHSFFVPDFRLKKDVLPGRYTELWFEVTTPGVSRVFCAEYCGLEHSQMWGEVIALEPEEFERWLDEQKRGLEKRRDSTVSVREVIDVASDLRAQGELVAVSHGCLKCHSVDGSPHIGPTWLDLYHRRETLTTGEQVLADEAYLTESMMDPGAKVVAGFSPVMPSYQGQLTPAETAALLEFIKSLRSDRPLPVGSEGPAYEPVRPR